MQIPDNSVLKNTRGSLYSMVLKHNNSFTASKRDWERLNFLK